MSQVRVVPLISDLDGNAPEYTLNVSSGSVTLTVDGAALVVEQGW